MHSHPKSLHVLSAALSVLILAGRTAAADCSRPAFTLGSHGGFGAAIVAVGDLDGDGVDEYAASSPEAGDGAGVVHIIHGRTASGLYSIAGGVAGGAFGSSLAFLGTIAGGPPTTSLLAVGAPCGASAKGRVTVFEVTGESAAERFRLDGEQAGDLLGFSLGAILKGTDSRLIVGSPGSNRVKVRAGRVLLVDRAGTVRGDMSGAGEFEWHGVTVAAAGDVNGDGTEDIVVGSIDLRDGGDTRGKVTVHDRDGTVLIDIPGDPGEQLGSAVAGAGDLDGDGRSEFMASATGFPPPRPCQPTGFPPGGAPGKVYVLRGGLLPLDAGGSLGKLLRILTPEGQSASLFGWCLASIPDLDGDGAREIAVGSPSASLPGKSLMGRFELFRGAGGRIAIVNGSRAGDRLGRSLAAIPDQDGDGVPDLLAGRMRSEGEVSLYSLADKDASGTRDACEACAVPVDLVDGKKVTFDFTRVARRKCLRFMVPEGSGFRLVVTGDLADRTTTARILLRWGAPPEREEYDESFTGLASSFPPFGQASGRPVAVYLSLEAGQLEKEGASIGVELEVSNGPILLGMTPEKGFAAPVFNLAAVIRGVRFAPGMSFVLRPRGGLREFPARDIRQLSPSQATAVFPLGGAPAGKYDLVAIAKGVEASRLDGIFEILASGGKDGRRITLLGPGVYRNNTYSRLTLRIENLGNTPLEPPLFQVLGPAGARLSFSRDPSRFAETVLGLGRSTLTPDGSLPPGGKVEIPIWFRKKLLAEECEAHAGDCFLSFEARVFEPLPVEAAGWRSVPTPAGMRDADWARARVELDRSVPDWSAYHDDLARLTTRWAQRGRFVHSALPAFELEVREALGLPTAAVTGIVRNRNSGMPASGAGVIATQGGRSMAFTKTSAEGYFILDWLENDSTYQLEIVRPVTGEVVESNAPEVKLPTNGDLHGVEVVTENAATGTLLEPSCPPCEDVALPTEPVAPPRSRFVRWASASTRVISSFDPNEKNGSGTQGGDTEIDPVEAIEYQIYFENLGGENGAAARRVEIDDFLPAEVDWTTVSLLDVVLDTKPESVLISLGSDEGGSSQSGGDDFSNESGSVTDPSRFMSSGASTTARGRWSGQVQYRDDDAMTIPVSLTVVATVLPSGEADLYGPERGVVSWSLDAELPSNAPLDAGFLPYGCDEDAEAPSCGGHVSFTVLPASGAAEDTTVTNDAEITFDRVDTILTDPPAVVTIRTQGPEAPFSPNPAHAAAGLTSAPTEGLRLEWESRYADLHDVYLWDAAEGLTRPTSPARARVWEADLPAPGYPTGEDLLELPPGKVWRWQAVAKNLRGAITEGPVWSFSTGANFRRGDADSSGSLQITDAIRGLEYLFLGGDPPGCLDALDADDSGIVNITDPILVLGFLFVGGVQIPPPGAEDCGLDGTADAAGSDLGCTAYGACP